MSTQSPPDGLTAEQMQTWQTVEKFAEENRVLRDANSRLTRSNAALTANLADRNATCVLLEQEIRGLVAKLKTKKRSVR